MIYIFETDNGYFDLEAPTREEAIRQFNKPYVRVTISKPWLGEIGLCDICHADLKSLGVFIDGRTSDGPWAKMCPSCFIMDGIHLGTGYGQMYGRKADGKFWKIGG